MLGYASRDKPTPVLLPKTGARGVYGCAVYAESNQLPGQPTCVNTRATTMGSAGKESPRIVAHGALTS